MRWAASLACMVLAMSGASVFAQAQTTVVEARVAGEVAHAGVLALPGSARLGTLASAAGVDANAYVLGAAWLRPALRIRQTREKAGLLYEIGMVGKIARADGKQGLAELAARWHAWVAAMPVTGRDTSVPTLEPHALQVSRADSRPLEEGDTLYYPARPMTIRVVGAVAAECDLAHVGLRDAADYLAQCPRTKFADPDTLFVIEPDGRVYEQGVALWNRSPPMPVAPGAVLLVPLAGKGAHLGTNDRFNRELAEFIATQPLGWTGSAP